MKGWSEGVVEVTLWTAQAAGSYREAAEALEFLGGICVSKSTIHRLVLEYGGRLAKEKEQEGEVLWESGVKGEEPPPPRKGEKEQLGISMDGMMVWVDGDWHEVKVGCCFGFGAGRDGEVKAVDITYLAAYQDVEVYRRSLWGHAYHQGLGLEGKGVVIGDGAKWIDGFCETYCPGGVRIVDWYHAVEHLWALGREAYGDGAEKWVKEMEKALWEGKVEEVVQGCQSVLAEREEWSEGVRSTARYFQERKEQMRYPEFRAAGYPIGSGMVESACKGFARRCKGRGDRWTSKGLNSILSLKEVAMGGPEEWRDAWGRMKAAA